jgi:hypothetical protein
MNFLQVWICVAFFIAASFPFLDQVKTLEVIRIWTPFVRTPAQIVVLWFVLFLLAWPIILYAFLRDLLIDVVKLFRGKTNGNS